MISLSYAPNAGARRSFSFPHKSNRGHGASMTSTTVFVVSNDPAFRDSVSELVESGSLQAETFPSLPAFLDAVQSGRRGCLVLDAGIDDLSDPERRARFAAACARMPTVLIADRGDVRTAVRAMKTGAAAVVQQPLSGNNLLKSIQETIAANEAADR